MSVFVDSVTGVDVALAVAGPGARAFAFVLDLSFRTILAVAWYVVAAALYNHGLSLARPLEPDRDVRNRGDAVQVDDDRDQPLSLLAIAQRAHQQACLAVFAGCEQAHVVSADGVLEQRLGLAVPVDDVLGSERVRVDERVCVEH